MTQFKKILTAALLLFAAPSAFAYLDPGTGSMLIQGLIAAVAMLGVTARLYWQRLLELIGVRDRDPIDESAESTESQSDT